MPAPLFTISSPDNVPMRLSDQQPYEDRPVQVLGLDWEGYAGRLAPGMSGNIPIYFHVPSGAGAHQMLDFNLETMVADATPIDWDEVEAEVRPEDMDPDLWAAMWTNFTGQIGDTWADYLDALDDQAAYLAQYGGLTYDVQELLSGAMGRASGACFRTTLAWGQDAHAPAPGVPLSFGRVVLDVLDQRFTVGPFGRGWSHNFEYILTQPDEDTAIVQGPGGIGRTFARSADGSWQPSPGDYGVLEQLGDGTYRLQEKDGLAWLFDATGRLAYFEETNGNRITLSYTGDHLTGVSHSIGKGFMLEYNAQGRVSRLTDHAGRVTRYSYDGSGEHLLSFAAPGDATTSYTYIAATGSPTDHALETITYPDGTHQYYAYDAQGHLAAQWRDGDVQRVELSYDALGTVYVTDASDAVSVLRLGTQGQPMQVQDPLGHVVQFQNDEQFNPTRLTIPGGGISDLVYDSRGNTTEVEDALGHTTTMGYTTDFNRLDWLRDARDNLTDFAYDSGGNLTSITYPDGSAETFGYDAVGNVVSVTNRRGDTITFTYNALGQATRKDYPDGRWATYTYDAVGRLTAATDLSGTTTLEYDDRGFLTRIEYPSGHWFTFAYNDAGRRTQRVSDDGFALKYHYDAAGRLERLADGDGTELVRYEYDGNGRLARECKGNGTYTTHQYDAAGQVTNMVNYAPDDAVQSRFDYTYDVNGNRTSMTTLEGTTTYEYDAIGQLVGVTYPDGRQVSYEYDAVGNRISVTDDGSTTNYATNNMNQYDQVGDVTYTYDADGNMTSKTGAEGMTTYAYDIENRLVRVTTPTGDAWEYTYDALGNRVAVSQNGVATRYVHDPVGLVDVAAEYDGSGALVARYVHGFGLVARVDAVGDAAFYAFDATGNARQLTDNAGAVANTYDYTPFGIPLEVNETIPNPFKYVGRFGVMDEGNGLNFMRARYYDSGVGRFISTDPLGLSAGEPNSYCYVANSPVIRVDPSGRMPVWMITAGLYLGVAIGIAEYYCLMNPWWCKELIVGVPEFIAEMWIVPEEADPNPPETFFGTIGYLLSSVRYIVREYHVFDVLSDLWEWVRAEVIRPRDPNEKVGPQGFGQEQIVTIGKDLFYTIYFENVMTATAPAQEVNIVDYLDPDLDWTTCDITEIAFGDQVIAVQEDTDQFYIRETLPDYRVGVEKDWWVDVSVQLDYQMGEVGWNFRTLDPETGELPYDPLAGFLPPNDATGRGEGHVVFRVRPRSDLANGTLVTNQATIVFDTEDAIVTNEVWNTIGDTSFSVYLPLILRNYP
jgi:RHS repeat-associated protein